MSLPFKHVPGLDGVRGLAVLSVVLHHTSIIGWGPFFQGHPPLPSFLIGGVVGVDIFFVLSGFLITNILISEYQSHGSISIFNFYMRRFLRLYPALLIVAGFSAALLFSGQISMKPQVLVYALTYTTNFAWAIEGQQGLLEALSLLNHAWSLAVEEQFYLVWPFFLVWALKSSTARRSHVDNRRLLGMVALIACACFAFQWVAVYFSDFHLGLNLATRTLVGRAGPILCGCATAIILSYRDRFPVLSALITHWLTQIVAFVGLMILVSLIDSDLHYIIYNAVPVSVFTSALLFGLSFPEKPKRRVSAWVHLLFSSAPLRYIGRISYGIYLYHVPIFFLFPASWVMGTFDPKLAFAIVFAIPFALSLAVSAFSFHVIEQPMLRRKDRYHRLAASVAVG
ncbi:acyltransferase family protein [Azospirillum sp. sgz302134]